MRHCSHCEQEITEHPITSRDAPFNVTVHNLKNIRADDGELVFCCVECAAMWFNKLAGEILMPDLDHPSGFFGSDGPMKKWPR
jgi:hypothetical protein